MPQPIKLLGRFGNRNASRERDAFEGGIQTDAGTEEDSRCDHPRTTDSLPAMHDYVFAVPELFFDPDDQRARG